MKKRIIIMLVAGLGLISCDKQSKFEKIIVNSSNYDLIIYSKEGIYQENVNVNGGGVKDSIIISSNTSKIVYFESTFGKVKNYSECKGRNYDDLIDSVKIIATPTKIVNFDINTTSKWIFSVEHKDLSGHGTCSCELEILESDIQ